MTKYSDDFLKLASKNAGVPLSDGKLVLPAQRWDRRPFLIVELPPSGSSKLTLDVSFANNRNAFADVEILLDGKIFSRKRFSRFCENAALLLPEARPGRTSIQVCVSLYWIGITINSMNLVQHQPDSASSDYTEAFARLPESFDPAMLDLLEIEEIHGRAAELRNAGLDPDSLAAFFSSSLTRAQQDDWAANSPVVNISFKRRFVESWFGEVRSPRLGGPNVRALSSLPLPHPMVTAVGYEYFDTFPFVLYSDLSFAGTVAMVLFPTLNLLVFDRNYWSSDWRNFHEVIGQYFALLEERGDEVAAYRGNLKKPLLLTKACGNMGHFLYNELCGVLSFVSVAKSLGRLDVVELGDKWIDCGAYLPEDKFNVSRTAAGNLIDRVLKDQAYLIHPTETRVNPEWSETIRQRSLAVFKRDDPERYTAFEEIRTSYNVLFVNLRAHNKSWVRQIEGLASFVQDYSRRVDRPLTVFFDGFGDCRHVMDEIVEKIHASIRVVNGLDASLDETLAWSYHCDFFIAVIGSGLVPLTWLADRPGICFAELQHMKQLSFWRLVRDAASPLHHPKLDTITQDKNAMYSNFDFPQSELTRILDEYFAPLEGSRPQHDASRAKY